MPVRVKVCGVTREQDAVAAAEAGADAIGLNFWSGSKRYVTPQRARDIVRAMPPLVQAVGVFVNATADEIRRVVDETGIGAVQLHGDEPPEACEGLRVPVIKAFRVDESTDFAAVARYPVQAVLFDAPGATFGGHGTTFDWSLLPARVDVPVVLAGGLTPENVADAVRMVRPWAVDVASGVETAPGLKDAERMRLFVRAAKEMR